MVAEKFTATPADIEITGATLLSLEEYKEYKDNVTLLSESWWLRSPGVWNYEKAEAYEVRYINCVNNIVHSVYAIRPALQISNLGDVEVGDKIKFGGKFFTVISLKYALCDTAIGHGAFREDSKAADANDYNASDIKKFVDEWFEKVTERKEGNSVANKNIKIDVAKKIWEIASISPEHGNAVMDVIGEKAYQNVMRLQSRSGDNAVEIISAFDTKSAT